MSVVIWDAAVAIPLEASFKDSSGDLVTATGGVAYVLRRRTDGTYDTYDFADNTFKTTAVTTETTALTHRLSNNATGNTGLHAAQIATLTGFTVGNKGVVRYYHPNASPTFYEERWQYGQVGNALG